MIKPSNQPPPAFSLDKRHQAAGRSYASRKEWRLLLILPVILVIMAVVMQQHLGQLKEVREAATAMPEPQRLEPRPKPDLAGLALPDAAAVDAISADARTLIEQGGESAVLGARDAIAVAWSRLRRVGDAAAPPVPLRVDARDLLLGEVRRGTAVALVGRLEDAVPAGDAGPARLLLALDEGQWAEVWCEALPDGIELGIDVAVSGRFLGRPDPGTALLSAHNVRRFIDPTASSAGDWRVTPDWRLPEDLFTGISDDRTFLETRAYYHLLRQSVLDHSTAGFGDDALLGNLEYNRIHQDPDAWRGKEVTLTGYVYQAWEDPLVARDRPFAVERVARVLFWRRDFSTISETVNGQKRESKKLVLRLFEAAITGMQTLPEPGQAITVTGRFFKFRAIPVKPNSERDRINGISRQSDKVYPAFIVAPRFTLSDGLRSADIGPALWAVGGLVAVVLIVIVLLVRRDQRDTSQMAGIIRRLRDGRRKAHAKPAPPPEAP